MPAPDLTYTVDRLVVEHLAADALDLEAEAVDHAVDGAMWRELAILSLARQHELTRELQGAHATIATLRAELRALRVGRAA